MNKMKTSNGSGTSCRAGAKKTRPNSCSSWPAPTESHTAGSKTTPSPSTRCQTARITAQWHTLALASSTSPNTPRFKKCKRCCHEQSRRGKVSLWADFNMPILLFRFAISSIEIIFGTWWATASKVTPCQPAPTPKTRRYRSTRRNPGTALRMCPLTPLSRIYSIATNAKIIKKTSLTASELDLLKATFWKSTPSLSYRMNQTLNNLVCFSKRSDSQIQGDNLAGPKDVNWNDCF